VHVTAWNPADECHFGVILLPDVLADDIHVHVTVFFTDVFLLL